MWLQKHLNKFTHQIQSYLKYYWNAKTLYNIHSPYLFALLHHIEKMSKEDDLAISQIDALRKIYLNDKTVIRKKDYGAGSRSVNSQNNSTIRKSYQASSSKSTKAQFLYKVVQYFKSASILELGTHLGVSTSLISLAHPTSKIISVEGDSTFYKIAKVQTQKIGRKNIVFVNDKFDHFLENTNDKQNYNLIFIDGNHTYDATLRYFKQLYNPLIEQQVIILDDIYWSEGMTRAWEEIKEYLLHGYCIDLFDIGIIINSKQIENAVSLKYISKRKKPLSFGFWG